MTDEMPREIWAGTVSHWNDGEGMYHHQQMGVCDTRYIRADIHAAVIAAIRKLRDQEGHGFDGAEFINQLDMLYELAGIEEEG